MVGKERGRISSFHTQKERDKLRWMKEKEKTERSREISSCSEGKKKKEKREIAVYLDWSSFTA